MNVISFYHGHDQNPQGWTSEEQGQKGQENLDPAPLLHEGNPQGKQGGECSNLGRYNDSP